MKQEAKIFQQMVCVNTFKFVTSPHLWFLSKIMSLCVAIIK